MRSGVVNDQAEEPTSHCMAELFDASVPVLTGERGP